MPRGNVLRHVVSRDSRAAGVDRGGEILALRVEPAREIAHDVECIDLEPAREAAHHRVHADVGMASGGMWRVISRSVRPQPIPKPRTRCCLRIVRRRNWSRRAAEHVGDLLLVPGVGTITAASSPKSLSAPCSSSTQLASCELSVMPTRPLRRASPGTLIRNRVVPSLRATSACVRPSMKYSQAARTSVCVSSAIGPARSRSRNSLDALVPCHSPVHQRQTHRPDA